VTEDQPIVSSMSLQRILMGEMDTWIYPGNINQALECEDKEFWKAAMLDELVNHEEVFGAFGPAVPRPPGIKATPTRFLFSKKMVSVDERKQDVKSLA